MGLAHLERSLILLELPQSIDGMENIPAMDGESLAHPALKRCDDGFASAETLNSRAERISGFVIVDGLDSLGKGSNF